MYISKLHIMGFRCFKDFEIKFNEHQNILVGNNSVGKSTILDAINLCVSIVVNQYEILFHLIFLIRIM